MKNIILTIAVIFIVTGTALTLAPPSLRTVTNSERMPGGALFGCACGLIYDGFLLGGIWMHLEGCPLYYNPVLLTHAAAFGYLGYKRLTDKSL